jgi:hypothetical protein
MENKEEEILTEFIEKISSVNILVKDLIDQIKDINVRLACYVIQRKECQKQTPPSQPLD